MTTAKSRSVSILIDLSDSLGITIVTMANEYVMDQEERSEQDIQNGRVRNVYSFLKEL